MSTVPILNSLQKSKMCTLNSSFLKNVNLLSPDASTAPGDFSPDSLTLERPHFLVLPSEQAINSLSNPTISVTSSKLFIDSSLDLTRLAALLRSRRIANLEDALPILNDAQLNTLFSL